MKIYRAQTPQYLALSTISAKRAHPRREGRGSSEHKEAINEDEMNTLSQYFTKNMQGSLNGRHLQEIVLFNIIYFIGRRGRENLRLMTKNTFKVSIDPKERKYIHQVTSEHDKNHTENNSDKDNEARIYEQKERV